MKKIKPIYYLIATLLLLTIWGVWSHDSAVSKQESVDQKWADVQAQYQRRADLIPNLVKTVKAAAENEKEILIRVTEARAGIVPGSYTPEQYTDKVNEGIQQAETPAEIMPVVGMIGRGRRFLMENYPEIKSTQNFRDFQQQLEGTENRITVARENYNHSVKEYNSHVRGLMNSLFLRILATDDFEKRELFEAEEGNDKAPDVDFE